MATEFHIDVNAATSALRDMKLEPRQEKKVVRSIVTKEIRTAKRNVGSVAKRTMRSDPRKASQAIQMSVYKRKAIGGNINILDLRKATYVSEYSPKRLSRSAHAIGGNRAPRSARTKQVDNYFGKSRGFVLRFLNSGTKSRFAGTRGHKFKGANRGMIVRSQWFANGAMSEAEKAAGRIGTGLTDMVVTEYNKK